VVVWAVGDGPDGGTAATRVAQLIARGRPDLVLFLGDVYTPDYTAFPAAYGELAARVFPTPGNHDWPENAWIGYLRYWNTVMGRSLHAYYALRVAGWEILSLNSEAPHGPGSAQLRWLNAQLAEPGTCRIGFWHRPRYSAGLHGDQVDMAPLWDALTGHASLVLAGHDHDMERLRPIGGLTELVSGAGGHGHYALDHHDPRVEFGNDTTYGALRITLTPGRAVLDFVALNGWVLDSSTVLCAPIGTSHRDGTAQAQQSPQPQARDFHAHARGWRVSLGK
jgi:hypothetical protein